MRRQTGSGQLDLPIGIIEVSEKMLRAAYEHCHLRVPFETAVQIKPLEICLRNAALSAEATRTNKKTTRKE